MRMQQNINTTTTTTTTTMATTNTCNGCGDTNVHSHRMYYLPCGADMCKACLEDQHVKTCKICSPDEDDDSEEDDEEAEARWREHEADYNSDEGE